MSAMESKQVTGNAKVDEEIAHWMRLDKVDRTHRRGVDEFECCDINAIDEPGGNRKFVISI